MINKKTILKTIGMSKCYEYIEKKDGFSGNKEMRVGVHHLVGVNH